MNWSNKKVNILYFLSFLFVVVVMYLINDSTNTKFIKKLSESFFWLSVPVFISSLITLFLNERVFQSWKKFTNYFLVLSVIVILITPTSTHGMDFFPIIKETVTIALATVYSVISLILIVYKSLKKE